MAADYRFSHNLVLRSVKDQVEKAGRCALSLPEPQPMSDDQEQVLDQMADVIKVIGDSLDKEHRFKDMVDSFAHLANKQSFQMLVGKVFHDGITWGKIVTLICIVGKSVVKIISDLISGVVSWTLDFFRVNLLSWITRMGGWINSIPSLADYSFERDFGASCGLLGLSFGLFFISGLMLGGFIAWRLSRNT